MLTIGRLAAVAEVTADRIRFYERQGLISAVRKNESGYRLYDETALRRLTFIRQAQQCGFSLAEIRELLKLRLSGEAGSEEAYRRIMEKKLQIERQARTMHAMAEALGKLLEARSRDGKPFDACPILAALETTIAAFKQADKPRSGA